MAHVNHSELVASLSAFSAQSKKLRVMITVVNQNTAKRDKDMLDQVFGRKGPQLAGISDPCFRDPRSLRADSGHFGAPSPVQKFPFLGDLLRAGIRQRPLSAGTKYNPESGRQL